MPIERGSPEQKQPRLTAPHGRLRECRRGSHSRNQLRTGRHWIGAGDSYRPERRDADPAFACRLTRVHVPIGFVHEGRTIQRRAGLEDQTAHADRRRIPRSSESG